MTFLTPSDEGRSRAFRAAASLAGLAVSVRDTRPWRWVSGARSLDLYTDEGRRLPVADPAGHLMTLSCGSGLHLARTALRAQGYDVWVERAGGEPAPDSPVARLLVADADVKPNIMALNRLRDRVDRMRRGGLARQPADPGLLSGACETAGGRMRVLHCDEVMRLASIDAMAHAIVDLDERRRRELAGRPRPRAHADVVDPHGQYAVLLAADDSTESWLRVGEAMAAVYLAAADAKLSVGMLSAPTENPVTRAQLVRLLGDGSIPALVLHLGSAAGQPPEAAARLFTSALAGAAGAVA
ncbi:MAG TPA: hypothetical protein VE172_21680 [Stackebrandtia sp.]|jgi:hypothetical protein|uniref:hypothetical protein n=1 Tax=Stackebrandtia sp. TaxID=2023065 RepID=UPI002D60A16D|nr:hypothetical protein [Stackebrandtia sp.]HZE41420.1 hypothetical protein [Stackebrandtia sp.]